MEPVYEVHGLCKYYGKKAALDGVDFTVEPGKLVGLLGPNGSGKTTLIKISAGLLTADSGTVCIDKVSTPRPSPATCRTAWPCLPSSPPLTP